MHGWLLVVDDALLRDFVHASGRRSALARVLGRARERRIPVRRPLEVSGWAVTGHHAPTSVWAPGRVTWLADFGDEAPLGAVRADPVHLVVGPKGLSPGRGDELDLRLDEARRMCAAIAEQLGDRVIGCRAGAADRWYLTIAAAPEGEWVMPDELDGRDLLSSLHGGEDGTDLAGLLNEIQIVLHQQPDNVSRRERGVPDANSVWLWGWGHGRLPRVGSWAARVWSSDPYATGLARMAGIEARELVPPVTDIDGDGIVVSSESDDPGRIDEAWCGPLLRAFDRGRIDRLRLVTSSGRLFEPRPRWFRAIWRRPGRRR